MDYWLVVLLTLVIYWLLGAVITIIIEFREKDSESFCAIWSWGLIGILFILIVRLIRLMRGGYRNESDSEKW